MKKPYDMHEEESQSPQVQDDSVVEYATTTQLPPYTMEELNARIDEAEAEFEAGRGIPSTEVFAHVRQMQLPPYTMEELNARIDEAEAEFERGEFFTSEEVHRGALEFLNSRKCS